MKSLFTEFVLKVGVNASLWASFWAVKCFIESVMHGSEHATTQAMAIKIVEIDRDTPMISVLAVIALLSMYQLSKKSVSEGRFRNAVSLAIEEGSSVYMNLGSALFLAAFFTTSIKNSFWISSLICYGLSFLLVIASKSRGHRQNNPRALSPNIP